jgi:hypothetical protein
MATYRSPGDHLDVKCGVAVEHAWIGRGGDEWRSAAAEMGKVEVRH